MVWSHVLMCALKLVVMQPFGRCGFHDLMIFCTSDIRILLSLLQCVLSWDVGFKARHLLFFHPHPEVMHLTWCISRQLYIKKLYAPSVCHRHAISINQVINRYATCHGLVVFPHKRVPLPKTSCAVQQLICSSIFQLSTQAWHHYLRQNLRWFRSTLIDPECPFN